MQFCKDKTLMKSVFVCPVGWGGTLCGAPTITGPARTAPLHPRYNATARSSFCCSQEPCNCLLASRSWPTAYQPFFFTKPSIKRSAKAQICLPQPTPIPHRVDIEATVKLLPKTTQNCQRCPETVKLLDQIPGLKVAFFSILAPGNHIPPHRGKHKGIIRYHLALKVPQPQENCRIRVADQIVHWQEGKSLIFDDTFEHEVWNDTNDYRVVLFLDIARPLRFPLSVINWTVNSLVGISPIVQVAKGNHESWEKQFEELLK